MTGIGDSNTAFWNAASVTFTGSVIINNLLKKNYRIVYMKKMGKYPKPYSNPYQPNLEINVGPKTKIPTITDTIAASRTAAAATSFPTCANG